MTRTGLNRFINEKLSLLKGNRVAVLCHPASVNEKYEHIIDLLLHHGVHLTTIFAPQHGFRGEKQDNMIESAHGLDSKSQLPVYSLYSETRTPTEEMLKDIDILIIDLQDVGTRVYTFIYTMALTMKACRDFKTKVIVLDRPNPIDANTVEGNILDTEFKSFVGFYPIPMRHGMTVGELALLFNRDYEIGCDLEVIEMASYKRNMSFEETQLPWVLPSPNMPTSDTALVYPGMVLFEGTLVSEGRGTTRPFEIFGAPYINPHELVDFLRPYKLPGVHFRPLSFEPTFHKFQGEHCGGLQIHVTDRRIFRPYLTGLSIIQGIKTLYPQDFAWKQPPYEYEYEKLPIDLLIGDQNIRKSLDTSQDIYYIEDSWMGALNKFLDTRSKHLIY